MQDLKSKVRRGGSHEQLATNSEVQPDDHPVDLQMKRYLSFDMCT